MEETSTYLVWEGDVLEFNYESQFLRVRSSQACQQTAIARKRALADRNGRRAQRHGSGAAAWMLEKCKCKFTSRAGRGRLTPSKARLLGWPHCTAASWGLPALPSSCG